VIGAAVVFAPAASAAEPQESVAAPPAPYRAPRDIEEVVVTARKREERSQDVPVALTAIGDEELQRYNLSDLTKIALERTLLFNVVGYRYHFDDLQVTFFDASAFNFITQTAKGANTTGTEAQLEWIPPIAGLEFHGTLSYNLARYDSFLSYCFAGQSAAEGCDLGPDGRPAVLGVRQDLSGTSPPLAPRWTAGMGFLYDHPVAYGWSIELGADSGYSDHYRLSPLGRRLFQDHFFRTDAAFRVFQDRGPLAISLFGRNLSNEYVVPLASADVPFTGLVGTGLPVSPLPSDEVAVAGRPRELGVEITARF
jgi:iron complex outermembrane receptor protein